MTCSLPTAYPPPYHRILQHRLQTLPNYEVDPLDLVGEPMAHSGQPVPTRLEHKFNSLYLTSTQITNIIFNETRSFSGPGVDQARYDIAQAIMNGDQQLGDKRPETAPTTAHVPKAEQNTYNQCLSAVQKARADRRNKFDPTNGSIYFNFRGNASTVPRYGLPVQTHVGPLNNSYPTNVLPATGNYANTYGSGK